MRTGISSRATVPRRTASRICRDVSRPSRMASVSSSENNEAASRRSWRAFSAAGLSSAGIGSRRMISPWVPSK